MSYNFEFEELIKRVTESIRLGTQKEIEVLCKEFNTPVQVMVKGGYVTSNCSDIMFINYTPLSVVSNGSCFVNNYELQPGGFVGWMGNNAEKNKDSYLVTFQSAVTKVVVLKKLYVNS